MIHDMSAKPSTLVTEAEFLALPVTMTRCELLDGEVIVAPAPSTRHQVLVRRLVTVLEDWAQACQPSPFVGLAPTDVRFADGRILQPDVFVVLGPVNDTEPGPVTAIPDLCVEVLSRDRVYDRVTKRMVYGESGVRELWTIDPAGLVERWTGEGLRTREEVETRLVTPLLPGFELDLTSLFA
jgi:Uma2 family endonuclease